MKVLLKISSRGFMLFVCSGMYSQVEMVDWIQNDRSDKILDYISRNDINLPPEGCNRTPLILAIQNGKHVHVSLFIERGADVNRKSEGISPLMCASGRTDLKKVSLLLDAGALLEDQDPDGNTALFYAVSNGMLKNTRFLIKKGANIHHRNQEWLSAYDIAVRRNQQEVASFLRQAFEKNLPDRFDVGKFD